MCTCAYTAHAGADPRNYKAVSLNISSHSFYDTMAVKFPTKCGKYTFWDVFLYHWLMQLFVSSYIVEINRVSLFTGPLNISSLRWRMCPCLGTNFLGLFSPHNRGHVSSNHSFTYQCLYIVCEAIISLHFSLLTSTVNIYIYNGKKKLLLLRKPLDLQLLALTAWLRRLWQQ